MIQGPSVSLDLNGGNSPLSDSCDENEENQRNETAENAMNGVGGGGHMKLSNHHFDNNRNGMCK